MFTTLPRALRSAGRNACVVHEAGQREIADLGRRGADCLTVNRQRLEAGGTRALGVLRRRPPRCRGGTGDHHSAPVV
jgi:hypothetical protein